LTRNKVSELQTFPGTKKERTTFSNFNNDGGKNPIYTFYSKKSYSLDKLLFLLLFFCIARPFGEDKHFKQCGRSVNLQIL
jgi:hypothetical protein